MRLRGGLPMYDLPELAEATDDWWAGLAEHLREAGAGDFPLRPERSERPEQLWLAPDLGLAQTCGYPLTHALAGRVRYVATPCYAAAGCQGTNYSSAIVVREGEAARDLRDMRNRRVAINGRDSHSGMNALRHAVARCDGGRPFFATVLETGSHRASLAAVQAGRADLAAIDCVTFALLQRVASEEVEDLRCLAWTAAAPGLPFITRGDVEEARLAHLRAGLTAAFADPTLADVRAALLLSSCKVLPEESYGRIVAMEREAETAGYPHLS